MFSFETFSHDFKSFHILQNISENKFFFDDLIIKLCSH